MASLFHLLRFVSRRVDMTNPTCRPERPEVAALYPRAPIRHELHTRDLRSLGVELAPKLSVVWLSSMVLVLALHLCDGRVKAALLRAQPFERRRAVIFDARVDVVGHWNA